MPQTVGEVACQVLNAASPADKVQLTKDFAARWQAGQLASDCRHAPPRRPARPERPALLAPGRMPKRRKGGNEANRVALLHALAHIELNAIDLAWDIIARFGADMPRAFVDDWVRVAADEARHFGLLQARLAELGATYGDLPAHDGLWQAAMDTTDDLAARLALVPMVLEARGLDVTPSTVERLRRFGDDASARILDIIYEDEIAHVAAGCRWFEYVCAKDGLGAPESFQAIIRSRFAGQLKPPFNVEARTRAGMSEDFYRPAEETGSA